MGLTCWVGGLLDVQPYSCWVLVSNFQESLAWPVLPCCFVHARLLRATTWLVRQCNDDCTPWLVVAPASYALYCAPF